MSSAAERDLNQRCELAISYQLAEQCHRSPLNAIHALMSRFTKEFIARQKLREKSQVMKKAESIDRMFTT